jgi:acetyl-CoA carboxylase carboxyl transferase subunit alpha
LGIIDDVVPEPPGGAHTDHDAAAALVDQALQKHLGELKQLSPDELVKSRYAKFRVMAQYFTES